MYVQLFIFFTELYYKDFFELPRRGPANISTSAPETPKTPQTKGRVRFHEEVRVRNIKAKGRGIPVSMMKMLDEEEDDDEEDDAFEEMSSFERSSEDIDSFEVNDDDMAELSDEIHDDNVRGTIERLKDDLFAEDIPTKNIYAPRS